MDIGIGQREQQAQRPWDPGVLDMLAVQHGSQCGHKRKSAENGKGRGQKTKRGQIQ